MKKQTVYDYILGKNYPVTRYYVIPADDVLLLLSEYTIPNRICILFGRDEVKQLGAIFDRWLKETEEGKE